MVNGCQRLSCAYGTLLSQYFYGHVLVSRLELSDQMKGYRINDPNVLWVGWIKLYPHLNSLVDGITGRLLFVHVSTPPSVSVG